MSFNTRDSFSRMQDGANSIYGLYNLDAWLCKYTRINDKPFSFVDREFQLPIIRDKKREVYTMKPAQTGLSELSYRWAVGACCVVEDMSVIYTFPTGGDSIKNNQTRIGPMIEGSPELTRLVSKDLNNSEIRKFGRNSFLFFKGTQAETAALSTPADAVIHDEWDKSDTSVGTTYTSRLQDKPHKIRKIFSTPTVTGHGIHKESRTSNRMLHLVQCNKCNHTFLPDYFQHVVIPDYDGPMEEITKENLPSIRYKEAKLLCPNCGRDPEMHHTRMPWVCENPDVEYIANTWCVSPFSAHRRILLPDLIESSTKYEKYSEFKNQGLGIVAEEERESITNGDIDKAQEASFEHSESVVHQLGADYGNTCHFTVGRELENGELLVVHRERVHYMQAAIREAELRAKYMILTEVHDSQPHSAIVNGICSNHSGAWGAVYTKNKGTNLFTAREVEEKNEEGKLGFRVVNVNRNVAFDALLDLIKKGKLIVNKSAEDGLFKQHMLSMKRVQKFTTTGELEYVWTKTDGEDHYHHSLLYLYIATKMRHTAGMPGIASTSHLPFRVLKKKGFKIVQERFGHKF